MENNSQNTDLSRNDGNTMLAEVFIGIIDEIREYFSRKYCKMYKINENNWKHIAPSSIDGLKVRETEITEIRPR